jgi:hypothetical protein
LRMRRGDERQQRQRNRWDDQEASQARAHIRRGSVSHGLQKWN